MPIFIDTQSTLIEKKYIQRTIHTLFTNTRLDYIYFVDHQTRKNCYVDVLLHLKKREENTICSSTRRIHCIVCTRKTHGSRSWIFANFFD